MPGQQDVRLARVKRLEREDVLKGLTGMLERLQPGEVVKIRAHDPNRSGDGRHFTIIRLPDAMPDPL